MTYKDDLDIIKAAEGDTGKLTLNAITELDNKGLLGRYSESGGGSEIETCDVSFGYGGSNDGIFIYPVYEQGIISSVFHKDDRSSGSNTLTNVIIGAVVKTLDGYIFDEDRCTGNIVIDHAAPNTAIINGACKIYLANYEMPV